MKIKIEAISKMVNCIIQFILSIKSTKDGFLLKMNGPNESHDSGLREAEKVHFECKQFADVITKAMRGFENESFIAFLRPLLKTFFIMIALIIYFGTFADGAIRPNNQLYLVSNNNLKSDMNDDVSINMGIGVDTMRGVDLNTKEKNQNEPLEDQRNRATATHSPVSLDNQTPVPLDKEAFSLNQQVLPKGIWHPRLIFGTVSEVSHLYNNTGVLTSIGRFNRTFNSSILKKFSPEFNELTTALNDISGSDLGDRMNLGSLQFSGGPEVSYFGFVMAYGLTDKWTIGVGIPVVYLYGSVTATAEGKNNVADIRKSLPFGGQELADINLQSSRYKGPYTGKEDSGLLGTLRYLEELEGQRLVDEFHQVMQDRGFKSINRPSTRSLGDIQIFSFYNYFNRYPWNFYLMITANLPTGPKDDPDDLLDFPNFAQKGLLVKTHHQFQASRNLTLGGALSYYWRLPDRVMARVPENEDDLLPKPERKTLLSRNLGDVTSVDTFGSYYLANESLILNMGLSWAFQPSDIYRGDQFRGQHYLLEKDTRSHWVTGSLGITFSSLPWFNQGRFFLPFMLAYNYSDILYGHNVIREVRHEASLLLFF